MEKFVGITFEAGGRTNYLLALPGQADGVIRQKLAAGHAVTARPLPEKTDVHAFLNAAAGCRVIEQEAVAG